MNVAAALIESAQENLITEAVLLWLGWLLVHFLRFTKGMKRSERKTSSVGWRKAALPQVVPGCWRRCIALPYHRSFLLLTEILIQPSLVGWSFHWFGCLLLCVAWLVSFSPLSFLLFSSPFQPSFSCLLCGLFFFAFSLYSVTCCL